MTTASWIPTLTRVRQFYPDIFKSVMGENDIIKELANWVLRTQRRDGTFPGAYGDFMNQPPRVFNNGQIIHALLDYYNVIGHSELVIAARNSAEWLVKVMSADGSWRQFTFHQLSSNTMTGAALIRLADITGDKKYAEAGEKNIRFALSLQKENGYLAGNGFDTGSSALTITIGYAIEGILEAGILSGNENWKNAALKALYPVLHVAGKEGYLHGEIDENYHSGSSYCCLAGNCLLAMISYKLASLTGLNDLRARADLLLNYVRDKQIRSEVRDISGGISGSWPISGNYCSYEIPSWAVRYFSEALMMHDSAR